MFCVWKETCKLGCRSYFLLFPSVMPPVFTWLFVQLATSPKVAHRNESPGITPHPQPSPEPLQQKPRTHPGSTGQSPLGSLHWHSASRTPVKPESHCRGHLPHCKSELCWEETGGSRPAGCLFDASVRSVEAEMKSQHQARDLSQCLQGLSSVLLADKKSLNFHLQSGTVPSQILFLGFSVFTI